MSSEFGWKKPRCFYQFRTCPDRILVLCQCPMLRTLLGLCKYNAPSRSECQKQGAQTAKKGNCHTMTRRVLRANASFHNTHHGHSQADNPKGISSGIRDCKTLLTPSQVFRKYSYSLSPDAIEFLEGILDNHEIPDDEVEHSMETLAKEYNKQDGMFSVSTLFRL